MVPTGWTRGLERFCSSPLSKETGPRVIDESNRGRRKQREHSLTILFKFKGCQMVLWGGGSGLDRGRSEDRKQRAGAGNEDAYTQLFKREGSNGWFKFSLHMYLH